MIVLTVQTKHPRGFQGPGFIQITLPKCGILAGCGSRQAGAPHVIDQTCLIRRASVVGALPPSQLSCGSLPPQLARRLGVCMDINPYEFEDYRWFDYEMATAHVKARRRKQSVGL